MPIKLLPSRLRAISARDFDRRGLSPAPQRKLARGKLAQRTMLASHLSVILAAGFLSACDSSTTISNLDPDHCDRGCIVELTDQYVDALIHNDAKAAPLAENVRLVENLNLRDIDQDDWDQGGWELPVEGPLSFSIHVPDPLNQQAGWMGIVYRADKPVLLALRLRFNAKHIVEAEHLVADLIDTRGSDVGASDLGSLGLDMQSEIAPKDRLDHAELIRIGASYYSALDSNDGSLSPFAADCKRVENGVLTAGEGAHPTPEFDPTRPGVASDCRSQIDSQAFVYIDRIVGRRMVAADPQTGLVMGFSRFRHSMDNLPYKVTLSDGSTALVDRESMPFEPFDLAAAHIFKVGPEGTITSIKAVGVMAPYGAPTAWD